MGVIRRLPSRLQQPTTMFKIVFIASFCLLLNQVSASNTCCEGFSCDKTCVTEGMCLRWGTWGGCEKEPGKTCTNGEACVLGICCCNGDKCNGGNFQNGSVFVTLTMAVISRFI